MDRYLVISADGHAGPPAQQYRHLPDRYQGAIDYVDVHGRTRIVVRGHPHVEGLADPLSFLDEISDLPDDQVVKIMGGNMMGLLGLPAA